MLNREFGTTTTGEGQPYRRAMASWKARLCIGVWFIDTCTTILLLRVNIFTLATLFTLATTTVLYGVQLISLDFTSSQG